MIANDESMIGELTEESCLVTWDDSESVFNCFNTCQEMCVGASTTDTREELGDRCDRFALHRSGIETFEFVDFEMDTGDLAVRERDIEAGRTFDFCDFADIKLTKL